MYASSYTRQIKTSSASDWTTLTTTGSPRECPSDSYPVQNVSTILCGLSASTTYNMRVAAVDSIGQQGAWKTGSFVTGNTQPEPTSTPTHTPTITPTPTPTYTPTPGPTQLTISRVIVGLHSTYGVYIRFRHNGYFDDQSPTYQIIARRSSSDSWTVLIHTQTDGYTWFPTQSGDYFVGGFQGGGAVGEVRMSAYNGQTLLGTSNTLYVQALSNWPTFTPTPTPSPTPVPGVPTPTPTKTPTPRPPIPPTAAPTPCQVGGVPCTPTPTPTPAISIDIISAEYTEDGNGVEVRWTPISIPFGIAFDSYVIEICSATCLYSSKENITTITDDRYTFQNLSSISNFIFLTHARVSMKYRLHNSTNYLYNRSAIIPITRYRIPTPTPTVDKSSHGKIISANSYEGLLASNDRLIVVHYELERIAGGDYVSAPQAVSIALIHQPPGAAITVGSVSVPYAVNRGYAPGFVGIYFPEIGAPVIDSVHPTYSRLIDLQASPPLLMGEKRVDYISTTNIRTLMIQGVIDILRDIQSAPAWLGENIVLIGQDDLLTDNAGVPYVQSAAPALIDIAPSLFPVVVRYVEPLEGADKGTSEDARVAGFLDGYYIGESFNGLSAETGVSKRTLAAIATVIIGVVFAAWAQRTFGVQKVSGLIILLAVLGGALIGFTPLQLIYIGALMVLVIIAYLIGLKRLAS